jgi:integrase
MLGIVEGKPGRGRKGFCSVRRKFTGRKMAEIGTAEIQGFYNEVAAHASSSTANRYLTLVRSIFNKAKAWGDFFGENPCAFVKKQRERGHRLRFLATDEIKSLYAVAHPTLYPVLVAALHTGMRQGEILALRWENVSLDRATIYILQSKSGKPREIPMTNKLHEVLTALGPRPEGLVFDLPLITLRRYFAKALKTAAISGFRFHDLRHTFASHFIMRTNDLTTLQKLLGHSTPAMTMRYAHLSKGHVQSAMAVFEATMPEKLPIPTLAGHQEGHHALSTSALSS